MGQQHQSQHRTRRESRESDLKESNQLLRSQLLKLRRENARLRRDYEKLVAHISDANEEVFEPVARSPEDTCPGGCSATLRKLALYDKVLVVCPDCKWREARSITR